MFFAFIDATFESWPETHTFRPVNPEHLRAWLLTRTKDHYHRFGNMLNIYKPDAGKLKDYIDMLFAAVAVYGYAIPELDETTGIMDLLVAKTIAWAELDEKAFLPIAREIYELIELHSGLKIKDWKRHEWLGSSGNGHRRPTRNSLDHRQSRT